MQKFSFIERPSLVKKKHLCNERCLIPEPQSMILVAYLILARQLLPYPLDLIRHPAELLQLLIIGRDQRLLVLLRL